MHALLFANLQNDHSYYSLRSHRRRVPVLPMLSFRLRCTFHHHFRCSGALDPHNCPKKIRLTCGLRLSQTVLSGPRTIIPFRQRSTPRNAEIAADIAPDRRDSPRRFRPFAGHLREGDGFLGPGPRLPSRREPGTRSSAPSPRAPTARPTL